MGVFLGRGVEALRRDSWIRVPRSWDGICGVLVRVGKVGLHRIIAIRI